MAEGRKSIGEGEINQTYFKTLWRTFVGKVVADAPAILRRMSPLARSDKGSSR